MPCRSYGHEQRTVAGRTVLELLAEHGTYRSQFETGTSSGGLTATFCFPDSVLQPRHFGTADRCDLLERADDFAESIAAEGRLDARIVDAAVEAGAGSAQHLKKVWHLVARFGSPATQIEQDG